MLNLKCFSMEHIIYKKDKHVSFISDVGGFATSLDLKLAILLSNLLKMQLS